MNEEELARQRRAREERFKEIRHADERFPIPWTKMSPEEFVARRWHGVGACSLHMYTYDDDDLNVWMKRFAEIIECPIEIEAARKSVLTTEEYNEVHRQIKAIEEGGL